MKTDIYGQIIYSSDDICDLLMIEPTVVLDNIFVEETILFSDDLELNNTPKFKYYKPTNLSVEEFDKHNQNCWLMPKEYYELDIAEWVLKQCKKEDELQRVGQELLLYHDRNMFNLLRYMKYLVDTMRKHNIVWGVGRGSSVASYVLYLIGVHKINSIYYDLSVDEFLK